MSIDPKANAWDSPYVSMTNNPIRLNDIKGDTIRHTQAFLNDAGYVLAYMKFAESKKGKELIKDYGIGGKYEHIAVVFDLGRGEPGKGGETEAAAVSRTDNHNVIPLDGVTTVVNSDILASGKEPDYYLRFTIYMNEFSGSERATDSDKLTELKNGANILHEFQHVLIGTLGLLSGKSARVPAAKDQHEKMRDPQQPYYWDRVNYWWQYTPIWYNDFMKDKKQSLEDAKDKNPKHYHKKIFTGMDYINEQDGFMD